MSYDVSTDTPIVESYLLEGSSLLTVKVYSMEAYLKDEVALSKPISGLNPTVNNLTLTETATGTYSSDLGSDTLRGLQKYNLSFEYLGRTVAASTTIPQALTNLSIEPASITQSAYYYFLDPTSDTTEILLSWDDPDHSFYQVYIESPATSDIPSIGSGGTQFRRRMMQPFQGSSYTTTSREFRSIGNYVIYVYRVNKDYIDLYERLSSSDLSNPTSAIQNAFGIFTAMSVAGVRFTVYEE
jgi:hypothetical protein